MKTDSLFYRLFQRLPALILEMAGIAVPDASGYQFRSEEIKQTAFRLDGLLVPPAQSSEWPIVFVEVQFQPDTDFYSRFFAEIFLYLHRYQPAHPWQAVVIYPDRACEHANRHYTALLGLAQVHRIYLEDFQGKPAPTLGVQLIQIIISGAEEALVRARALVQQAHQEPTDPAQRTQIVDFIETILIYKLPHLSREEIQNMLGLTEVDLKQTRFYQEVFAEGRQEGRKQGEYALLLRLLERKFGPLDDATRQRVMAAAEETLLVWGERVLTAASLQEVFQ